MVESCARVTFFAPFLSGTNPCDLTFYQAWAIARNLNLRSRTMTAIFIATCLMSFEPDFLF